MAITKTKHWRRSPAPALAKPPTSSTADSKSLVPSLLRLRKTKIRANQHHSPPTETTEPIQHSKTARDNESVTSVTISSEKDETLLRGTSDLDRNGHQGNEKQPPKDPIKDNAKLAPPKRVAGNTSSANNFYETEAPTPKNMLPKGDCNMEEESTMNAHQGDTDNDSFIGNPNHTTSAENWLQRRREEAEDKEDSLPKDTTVTGETAFASSTIARRSTTTTASPLPPEEISHRKSILKTGTCTNNTAKTTESLEVSFDTIHVRHYSMELGDHPSCSIGAPISLSWTYTQDDPLDLDVYEFDRQPQRRQKLRFLVLNYYQRQDLLRKAGHSENELKQADRRRAQVQTQRSVTRLCLPLQRVEEVLQSGRRKMKRLGCWQSHNTSKQQTEEEQEHEERVRTFTRRW